MAIPINKYPYTDLHELNLDWVLEQVKTAIAGYEETKGRVDNLERQFNDLKAYVEDFIEHLDIDQIVRDYLDELVADGTISQMIQDVISTTFDNVPTQNSTNGVVSGGVYTAIQNVPNSFDAGPTQNSNNGVKSGGVYAALKDLFIYQTNAIDVSDTVPASGNATTPIPAAPPGYQFFNVMVTGTGQLNVLPRSAGLANGVILRNISTTAQNYHLTCDVVYIKTFA